MCDMTSTYACIHSYICMRESTHQRATNCRSLLREMTLKDRAFYGSCMCESLKCVNPGMCESLKCVRTKKCVNLSMCESCACVGP